MSADSKTKLLTDNLHPVLAGYFHDGAISQRDCLAAVFHLIDKGYMDVHYLDNNVLNEIAYFELRKDISKEKDFDESLLKFLFGDRSIIPFASVKWDLINGKIEQFIKSQLDNLLKDIYVLNKLTFNTKRTKMEISINGIKIDSFEKFKEYENTIKYLLIPGIALIGIGIILIQIYNIQHHTSTDIVPFFIGIGVIITAIQTYISVKNASSQKIVNKEYEIIDKKYRELYEFLSNRPINQRKANLEYIGYAIAFGLNNAFDKEFGVEAEPKMNY